MASEAELSVFYICCFCHGRRLDWRARCWNVRHVCRLLGEMEGLDNFGYVECRV